MRHPHDDFGDIPDLTVELECFGAEAYGRVHALYQRREPVTLHANGQVYENMCIVWVRVYDKTLRTVVTFRQVRMVRR